MSRYLFIILGLFACMQVIKAGTSPTYHLICLNSMGDTIAQGTIGPDEAAAADFSTYKKRHKSLKELMRKTRRLNKKITAAILAFPFPFGIVGLHRIYMGTKPYVPVVYIATVGGVFGILPFIDFCAITLDKDFEY